jgi:hypothetical protein
MSATATLPGDIRRFYFDGEHFSLVDEGKYVYSTVPLAASLDELPAELAKIYGFTPPLAEFLVSDLYQDLTWRAAKVELRGSGTIRKGLFGAKGVRCHRLGLTGQHADSELWVGEKDLLPWRWISRIKEAKGEVVITFELSKWNLNAKTRDKDFVLTPDKDFMEVPMVTEAEMAAARLAATEQEAGGKQ